MLPAVALLLSAQDAKPPDPKRIDEAIDKGAASLRVNGRTHKPWD